MSPRWRGPARLRPAFSLRSLLLAITLTACALGYRILPEPWRLRFRTDASQFSDVTISPDGALLATGEYFAPRVTVWNVRTAAEVFRFDSANNPGRSFVNKGSYFFHQLCFSDDGSRLLCANGSGLITYDLQTGRRSHFTPTKGDTFVFSPQGKRVAVYRYDSQTIEVLKPGNDRTSMVRIQMDDVPDELMFSPDSSVLLVRLLRHYEWVPLETNEPRVRLQIPASYQTPGEHFVAIAPNSHLLAISWDGGSIEIHSRDKEKPVAIISIAWNVAPSLAWSADSRLLAIGTGALGDAKYSAEIVDADTGEVLVIHDVDDYVQVQFDKRGEQLIGTSFREQLHWDVKSGEFVRRVAIPEDDEQIGRYFSQDGNSLLAWRGDVTIWQRLYPEHWQPWLRGLYIALTSLAALALVVSLAFDQRRRRTSQPPTAATVAT